MYVCIHRLHVSSMCVKERERERDAPLVRTLNPSIVKHIIQALQTRAKPSVTRRN